MEEYEVVAIDVGRTRHYVPGTSVRAVQIAARELGIKADNISPSGLTLDNGIFKIWPIAKLASHLKGDV